MENEIKRMFEAIAEASKFNSSVTHQLCVYATQARSAFRWASEANNDLERKLAFAKLTTALGGMDDMLSTAVDNLDPGIGALFSTAHAVRDTATLLVQDLAAERSYDTHSITDPAIRDAVFILTGGVCAYCGSSLKADGAASSPEERFCVEHVVPKSSGGPDNLANYVPACCSCNSSKGDRHVLLFIKRNLPNRIARAELKVVNGGEA